MSMIGPPDFMDKFGQRIVAGFNKRRRMWLILLFGLAAVGLCALLVMPGFYGIYRVAVVAGLYSLVAVILLARHLRAWEFLAALVVFLLYAIAIQL